MSLHTLSDSVFSGLVAAGATAGLISARGRVNLFNMSVNAPLAVGAVVFGADYVAEMLKVPVLSSLGLESPTAVMAAPLAVSGLATYGLLRVGVSDRVSPMGSIALGAVSSYAGPMLRQSVGL